MSVGENTYGHPVPSTLAAIAATGAPGLADRRAGTITVRFSDGVPLVEPAR